MQELRQLYRDEPGPTTDTLQSTKKVDDSKADDLEECKENENEDEHRKGNADLE